MSQAADDVIQPPRDKLLNGGLVVNPQCAPLDLAEDIDAKFYQLRAALIVTHGVGGETFRTMSPDLQDGYLWGVRESLNQVIALWERYAQLMREGTFDRS